MPDSTIATNEQAMNEAEVVALSIADPDAVPPTEGKVRFFDNTLIPDVTTTKVQMVAAEITLGGYPAGGYDITEMFGPTLVAGGGAVITTPGINVAFTVAPGAVLGGGWIEDSTGGTRRTFLFDPARPLQAIGDGFVFIRQMLYGRNSV